MSSIYIRHTLIWDTEMDVYKTLKALRTTDPQFWSVNACKKLSKNKRKEKNYIFGFREGPKLQAA